eukprot:2806773-Pleurochrysis_carterae.AAC.1
MFYLHPRSTRTSAAALTKKSVLPYGGLTPPQGYAPLTKCIFGNIPTYDEQDYFVGIALNVTLLHGQGEYQGVLLGRQ